MKIKTNKVTKPIKADEEILDEVIEAPEVEEVAEVEVDAEATDILFEAEDVAELVAEITGEPIEVSVDEDEVIFAVGEDEFVVTPDGDEEILEAVRRPLRNKRPVKATAKGRRPLPRRPIKEACHTEEKKDEKKEVKASRTIKKFPKTSK